jgi:hypothetical protein
VICFFLPLNSAACFLQSAPVGSTFSCSLSSVFPGPVSCDSFCRHSAWFVCHQDLCTRFSISVFGACFLDRFYFPCAPARGSSRVLGGPVSASPFFPVQRTSAPFSFKTAPATFSRQLLVPFFMPRQDFQFPLALVLSCSVARRFL